MMTSTLRTGIACLALIFTTGCASVAAPPAPNGTAVTAKPEPGHSDNAGWRRIHAGAGRT